MSNSSASKRSKPEYSDIDKKSVNTIRVLGADMVQKANSGHPGRLYCHYI